MAAPWPRRSSPDSLDAHVPAASIHAADPQAARREHLRERFGIRVTDRNGEVVARSDIVVLAVKPGLVGEAIASVRDEAASAQPLWISVAAGVPLRRLAALLPEAARIVRAMPNTPALIRAGATAWAAGEACSPDDRGRARALFETVGIAWEAPAEALLDAVTGLSGSGPAYVFEFLEALADAGVRVGLPREAAARLAAQTVVGAARMVVETGRPPAQLRDQVTSPGGTTLAGLERLESHGFRAAIYEAVAAAAARSRELGGG